MQTGKKIFVLDIADAPTFAFEADSVTTAEALVQSPWIARAVTDFCAKRGKALNGNGHLFARLATEAEASLYRDLADEFTEATDRFLVAHLTGPSPDFEP
jgi:hypothetical protein